MAELCKTQFLLVHEHALPHLLYEGDLDLPMMKPAQRLKSLNRRRFSECTLSADQEETVLYPTRLEHQHSRREHDTAGMMLL